MKYRTLFNVRIGRVHVFGDIDGYISLGVSVGLHMIRLEIGPVGLGACW